MITELGLGTLLDRLPSSASKYKEYGFARLIGKSTNKIPESSILEYTKIYLEHTRNVSKYILIYIYIYIYMDIF